MKQQIQEKENINTIAKKVENSSQMIENILQKIYEEKNAALMHEKNLLESKEKNLAEREQILQKEEKSQLEEKEKFLKVQSLYDEEKKKIQQDKTNFEMEIKMKYDQLSYELKREAEFLRMEYENKLKILEETIRKSESEKKSFEKFKEESIKEIHLMKTNFDEKRLKYLEEETEIKTRLKFLQEKENFISQKISEFERTKSSMEEKERKVERDRRELMIAAKRLEEGIKNLDEKGKTLEIEKHEVLKVFQQCENEKNLLNLEKVKIEQAKQELKYRINSIQSMSYKFHKNQEILQNSSTPFMINNNNSFNSSVINLQPVTEFNFSAEEYFKNLQMKLNQKCQSQSQPQSQYQLQFNSHNQLNKTRTQNFDQNPNSLIFNMNSNILNEDSNLKTHFMRDDIENLRKIRNDLEDSYYSKNFNTVNNFDTFGLKDENEKAYVNKTFSQTQNNFMRTNNSNNNNCNQPGNIKHNGINHNHNQTQSQITNLSRTNENLKFCDIQKIDELSDFDEVESNRIEYEKNKPNNKNINNPYNNKCIKSKKIFHINMYIDIIYDI